MKKRLYSAIAMATLCFASATFGQDKSQPAPTMDVKQLPASVQTTLQSENARISKVEQQTENGTRFYEATLSKGGKNYVLRVGDDGKVLKRDAAQ
jgi:hypothetical protein